MRYLDSLLLCVLHPLCHCPSHHLLSCLLLKARIRTAYFDELETPLQVSDRALAAAADLAASVGPGRRVACVTHSVILESLCAAAFHKDFESVHTQTLAWMKCVWTERGGFVLEATSGVEFVSSPDALALDLGVSALAHESDPSATSVRSKNAMACGAGLGAAAAVATSALASTIDPATAALMTATSALVASSGLGVALGGAVRDARTLAVAKKAAVSLMLAAAATGGTQLLLNRPAGPHWHGVVLARWLSLSKLGAIAQASAALCLVAASEILVALGWRVSLRAAPAPLGLWLPLLTIARPSAISGTKEDVASKVMP